MITPKHGDIAFVRNEPVLTDPSTWMAVPIRAVLNADNPQKGLPNMTKNHCADFIEIGGVLYVQEAKQKVIRTPWDDWRRMRAEGSYEIKSPVNNFDDFIYRNRCDELLGRKYDYIGVIVCQTIRQCSGKKIWTGGVGVKRVSCCKHSGYVRDIQGYAYIDPEDLYFSGYFA